MTNKHNVCFILYKIPENKIYSKGCRNLGPLISTVSKYFYGDT